MDRLWPDTAVEEANLTQNVFVARKALGESPGEQRFIATVARQGYRFVAEVREVVADDMESSGAAAVTGGGRGQPACRPTSPGAGGCSYTPWRVFCS